MDKLTKETLVGLTGQLASSQWHDGEIDELVSPKLGIITGFQDLLNELEVLRKIDLESIAPAQGVQPQTDSE